MCDPNLHLMHLSPSNPFANWREMAIDADQFVESLFFPAVDTSALILFSGGTAKVILLISASTPTIKSYENPNSHCLLATPETSD